MEKTSRILPLFKYQPLIELRTDTEEKEWQRRLINTLKQEIWLQPLSDFNDPFERHFKYISDPTKAVSDPRLFDHLHDFHIKDTGTTISAEDFKSILLTPEFQERVSIASNSWINGSYHQHGPFSQHGTYCFTNDASNIPMWAHYANNHRGYCVMFELDFSSAGKLAKIPESEEENYFQDLLSGKDILTFYLGKRDITFAFTKVNYSKTPPVMQLDQLLDIIDSPYESIKYLVANSVGVKYHQWGYENEYRLVANTNSKDGGLLNLSLIPFIKVTGIIMGSQLTDDERTIFHSLCKENKVPLYQARCSEVDYEITKELIGNYFTS
ncbi:MAG: DUF2971 domain-containing protein [Gammaproteobacteria bacterium]|nr:DUF2971 domain-containing protein [Gammaproteobacteria bacterium]MCW5582437.1 DUF2971 domain-containing protein [Gammaproteobacteria bacterium]